MSARDVLSRQDLEALAETIQAQEFDSPFTLDREGVVRPVRDVWVPDIMIGEEGSGIDVLVDGDWGAMTGLTGQYSYNGAVMHPSEYIGDGVAAAMLDLVLASEDPVLFFAITEVRESDGSIPDGDPVGWAILYRDPE